jgi:hypothetical protein
MSNFDPFRLSQRFEPNKVNCELPPIGLLEFEESIQIPERNSKLWLFLLPFILLLILAVWSQIDHSQPIPKIRSVFH